MSTVYNLEPPTKGKVILKTSLGNIDVELWPKEAPLAVRNFVQLALEGYYDGSIFHRMIKDFLVQGGDPTGTGTGGESIFGGPFKDEFHSRLRFTHRGLLACANQNEKDTNGAQFFFTLDATTWLDKRNTIFGRVAGDTIYNLLKFNELEVDDDDRPLEPPVLLEVEVVWNPFENIVPRITAEQRRAMEEAKRSAQNKKPKREGKRKLALLSFGEEAEQEEQELLTAAMPAKIRSAHDVLEDSRLEKAAPSEIPEAVPPSAELQRVRDRLGDKKTDGRSERESNKRKAESGGTTIKEEEDAMLNAVKEEEEVEEGGKEAGASGASGQDFAAKMRSKMEARRQAMGDARRRKESGRASAHAAPSTSQHSTDPGSADHKEGITTQNEDRLENRHRDKNSDRNQSADKDRSGGKDENGDRGQNADSGKDVEVGALRERGHGSESDGASSGGDDGEDGAEAEVARRRAQLEQKKTESRKRTLGRVVTETQVENADLLKPYQISRERYKQRKRLIGNREKDTLERLNRFKTLLKGQAASGTKPSATTAPIDNKTSAGQELQTEADAANVGKKTKSKEDDRGYNGEVRKDLDHRDYMPAAWRVDDYLHDLDEEDDDQGIEGLRGHKLQFSKSEKKDHMQRSDNVDDYVVFDPLLEKGKGKFSKMQQKEKKRNTEWAGRSVT